MDIEYVLDAITNIGTLIRNERIRKKIRQKDLALRAQISNTYLSDIEHLRAIPSLTTYARICAALDVDLNFIEKNPD